MSYRLSVGGCELTIGFRLLVLSFNDFQVLSLGNGTDFFSVIASEAWQSVSFGKCNRIIFWFF